MSVQTHRGSGLGETEDWHSAPMRADASSVVIVDVARVGEPLTSALRRLSFDSAAGSHVILDARTVARLPPGALAAFVRLRRRVRARGGLVVVVAGEVAWTALRRSGLHHALPCVASVEEAIEALPLPRQGRPSDR
jgi:hypothetical protein